MPASLRLKAKAFGAAIGLPVLETPQFLFRQFDQKDASIRTDPADFSILFWDTCLGDFLLSDSLRLAL
jgi:hypothetical protein